MTELRAVAGFSQRHIGPNSEDLTAMLAALGYADLDTLSAAAVPKDIYQPTPLRLDAGLSEPAALARLQELAKRNQVMTSLIGMGYHATYVPAVIQRNVLENPGWYTAYTPYQPEIAQGRLEGLLNFQQLFIDLSGLEMANASMLDEATAAAEAMAMAKRQQRKNKSQRFFVDAECHPQTLAVLHTRARHFGFELVVDSGARLDEGDYFGALFQYPGSSGAVPDLEPLIAKIHQHGGLAVVAADPLSLVLLRSPGAMGADIAIGNSQRFGVPMGFGGPHAAFFAFREAHKRAAPGRIIGVSRDRRGHSALRMAMQTREQHIRREKANSNICTSQVLLALMSGFYAVYHGAEGLRAIAERVHQLSNRLATGLRGAGLVLRHDSWFDTLAVETGDRQAQLYGAAQSQGINLRKLGDDALGISLNEASDEALVETLIDILSEQERTSKTRPEHADLNHGACAGIASAQRRSDEILSHPVFQQHRSETAMLRYLHRLESRDMALNQSMIPLGSCTMKLNATSEMLPLSWPEFSALHPYAPIAQTEGYQALFAELETMLADCTGYAAVSLQPNAGSQGEYAGLLAIRAYHHQRGETQRQVCLIPASAHGTNPASAQMAGLSVVVVDCDDAGNIDFEDLQAKAEQYGEQLAALMITYPSTHGVFENGITQVCELIHRHGGQVYVDGANLNAMVGIASPGTFGGDVSHINLHKTFAIPHGGGGPGMGPIAVKAHLAPFLPGHPLQDSERGNAVSATPWGSASILTIPWMYITMMGAAGLRRATQVAILSANYIARALAPHYPLLYTGNEGLVAHECLIDIRPIRNRCGITEEDIAKRLMDYGFHAPTMSFPVAGTLMIEPTESEPKAEIDRFIKAMILIRGEIARIENGEWSQEDNPLVNAPHTANDVLDSHWQHPYCRETAVRPTAWLRDHKIWPSVNRIDNVYGDRNLICSCPPLSDYQTAE